MAHATAKKQPTFGDLLWLWRSVIVPNARQCLNSCTSFALDAASHHLKANNLHIALNQNNVLGRLSYKSVCDAGQNQFVAAAF